MDGVTVIGSILKTVVFKYLRKHHKDSSDVFINMERHYWYI